MRQKTLWSACCLALLILNACVIVPVPVVPAARNVPVQATPQAPNASEFAQLMNAARRANGLGVLRQDQRLRATAQAYAEDMARRGYFSHRGADGRNHPARVAAQGYNACFSAENLATGQTSQQQVFRAWMESPGHRRNMLRGSVTEFGLGRSGDIWVLVFANAC